MLYSIYQGGLLYNIAIRNTRKCDMKKEFITYDVGVQVSCSVDTKEATQNHLMIFNKQKLVFTKKY